MKKSVIDILGSKIPTGATSFSTYGDVITFCIGKTGQLMDLTLTSTEKQNLQENDLLGSFGMSIND